MPNRRYECRAMPRPAAGSAPLHVSIVAIPEAVVSTLTGIFDVMNALSVMPAPGAPPSPFEVEIVGLKTGSLDLASRVPIKVQRSVAQIDTTDIVIVPRFFCRPVAGRRAGIRNWSSGSPPCIGAARCCVRPARGFS
jgi:hypothetical protein